MQGQPWLQNESEDSPAYSENTYLKKLINTRKVREGHAGEAAPERHSVRREHVQGPGFHPQHCRNKTVARAISAPSSTPSPSVLQSFPHHLEFGLPILALTSAPSQASSCSVTLLMSQTSLKEHQVHLQKL